MTRTTIRSEDITAGQVKSADLASDAVDTTSLETDIALLGFKVAANGSMAAYNLKDQTIDAFEDASGIDASASTDEIRNASNYYSGTTAVNYFGDSSDGALTTSGNVTHTVQNKSGSYDGDMVVKQYSSLTISAGHTMTVDQPCRGMFIYVKGDCTINGTLSASAKGALADPTASGGSDSNAVSASGIQYAAITSGGSSSLTMDGTTFNGCGTAIRTAIANQTNPSSNGTIWTISRAGASGGGGRSTSSGGSHTGNNGTSGSAGESGGGGGGGIWRHSAALGTSVSGSGAAGTCFSGGSGGGGSASNQDDAACTAGSGTANGGAGGAGCDVGGGSEGGGGGAGNPSGAGSSNGAAGTDGTGGLLFLVVGGNLTIGAAGTIQSNGSAGGGGSSSTGSGGGSGGGNVVVLYGGTLSNSGSISATGGSGGANGGAGGNGGNGSVQTAAVTGDSYLDMILISNSTTAESTPTTGDIVMTYTNGAGTATVNTDLKAYISRDDGTTWTQATLSSEGTTGGHTILTAHNVDISSQPSGTSMRYKITTHNQSASKETRIQAVSLGWS